MVPPRRLFFALQPTAAMRQRLRDCGPAALRKGRRVPADNLHLTLHFLGNCGEEQEARLRRLASCVRAPAGQITLSRLTVWPGPRVQVAESWGGRVPVWLKVLHGAVAEGLRADGFPLESRTYRPHVTLARKCPPHEDVRIAPVCLQFRDFVLMASESGAEGVSYRVIGRWSLRPSGRGARLSADMG